MDNATHRNKRTVIRQLVVTEANYVCLIRELDRVENQCSRARTLRAATTLTLVEWLETLAYFHWQCAYCQEKPFQVMSHYLSLPYGEPQQIIVSPRVAVVDRTRSK